MNLDTDLMALHLPFLYPCPPTNLLPCLKVYQSSRANKELAEGGEQLVKPMLCLVCPLSFDRPKLFLEQGNQERLPRDLPPYVHGQCFLGSFGFHCSAAVSTKGFPDDRAKASHKGNGSLSTGPGMSQVLSKLIEGINK